jgi:ATP-dependent Lhr-like helicase
LQDLTAWVKKARSHRGAVPVWTGTSLPISDELGEAVRVRLAMAGMRLGDSGSDRAFEDGDDPEMHAVRPILALQMRLSRLPAQDELLVERLKTREGHHLFFYPFSGKLVHQGLAALFAYRLSRLRPLTFTLTANDYGLELLSPEPAPLDEALNGGAGSPSLLSCECLLEDIHASLNASEMARRQFREIARVAGLVFQGYPGRPKRSRHLQASSGLFYDVFEKYDAGNLLLDQAQREVLSRQLEADRLKQTLQRLQAGRVTVVDVLGPTPLGLPLLVERMQAQLSSETLADRVRRMQVRWEG